MMLFKKEQFEIKDLEKFRINFKSYTKYRNMNLRPGKLGFFWGELNEKNEFEISPTDFKQRLFPVKVLGLVKNQELLTFTKIKSWGIIFALMLTVFLIGIELTTNFIFIPTLIFFLTLTINYSQIKKDHHKSIAFIKGLIENDQQT